MPNRLVDDKVCIASKIFRVIIISQSGKIPQKYATHHADIKR